jgi:hypothetical protein
VSGGCQEGVSTVVGRGGGGWGDRERQVEVVDAGREGRVLLLLLLLFLLWLCWCVLALTPTRHTARHIPERRIACYVLCSLSDGWLSDVRE